MQRGFAIFPPSVCIITSYCEDKIPLFSSKCFRDGFLPIKNYLLGSERRNLET